MCHICGRRMRRVKDIFGYWDGETYCCDHCSCVNDDDEQGLNVYDAALIWASNGKDEDYMFGYTEEKLEDAL